MVEAERLSSPLPFCCESNPERFFMNNPDLLQAGTDTQTPPSVPALKARTAPLEQHVAPEPVWFKATIPNCSLHRPDGKRLPFMQGFLKATMQEDIDYLSNEIRTGNPYIALALLEEVAQAKAIEDPVGAMRDALRPEIVKEYVGNLSLDSLEALLAEKRAAKAVEIQAATQATNAAGNSKAADLRATAAKAAALAAAAKTAGNTHAAATGANTSTVAGATK